VTITVQETVPNVAAAAVPERPGRGLLRWLHSRDVRPAFYGLPVTSPASVEGFAAAWQAQQAEMPTIAAVLAASQLTSESAAELAPRLADLMATDQYRTQYQPFGAAFATVSINDLIVPQWWTDTGYVDELTATVPAAEDLDGLFDYCFPAGQLDPPMMLGTNGAAFSSSRHHLGAVTPLRVVKCSPAKVTFEFDVTPRANWTWLATATSLRRPMVINGVHHLLALLNAGRTAALCLVCAVNTPLDLQAMGMNYQDPFLFKPDQLMSPRPPLLRDFLDPAAAVLVSRHGCDQFMRLAVNAETGAIPQQR
jgi:hypothetical protein